jgi:CO/xanthine dehydrogenase FAD-binding subunit
VRAGPMIALTAALDGECVVLRPDGSARRAPAATFVTGDATNVLADGELLRAVHLPAAALTGVSTYRQGSLFRHGRSAVLVAGRRDPNGTFVLTVTAATWRPYQLRFPGVPEAEVLQMALANAIPDPAYVTDVHGSPVWRRHLTRAYAEEIRAELAA